MTGKPPPARASGPPFSEYTYIYNNLSRHPGRYAMTVTALSLCVIFFILIGSLALGLQEEVEGGLESDEPTPDVEGTSVEETGPKSAELGVLEDDVKGAVLSWLYVLAVLLFATSGTTIATTMMMNVRQREKEIGVLKSVGLTDSQVQRIFINEAAWLCFAAMATGGIVGLTIAMNVFNAEYEAGAGGMFFAPARTTPVIILAAAALTFTTGMLATWYPARQASRMDPVRAMAP